MAAPSSNAKAIKVKKHFFQSLPVLSGKAGATIAVGNVLEEASGLLTLADHDDAATIVGVATSAGASGDTITYIPAWSEIIFSMTLDGDTNGPVTTADANLFQQYGLGIDAGNGNPYVNTDETSAVALTVVGYDDAAGTSRGRVLVTFMPNKTVWGA